MTQMVEILPRVRPGHQQPWYVLGWTGLIRPPTLRVNQRYRHSSVAVTPVQYECDYMDLTNASAKAKCPYVNIWERSFSNPLFLENCSFKMKPLKYGHFPLTHWSQGNEVVILYYKYQTHIKDRYLAVPAKCPHVNATRPHWWFVNIGSGNGLVPWRTKTLLEPMLTQIYVAILYDTASLSQNE